LDFSCKGGSPAVETERQGMTGQLLSLRSTALTSGKVGLFRKAVQENFLGLNSLTAVANVAMLNTTTHADLHAWVAFGFKA
jgi:hypothetical protein